MNIVLYLAFLVFYIICFCFMYIKNTELISFSVLFFLTAIFITYNINNIYLFITNYQPNNNPYISQFSFLTSIFGLVAHFIGLLLIITTTMYLKTKNEYQTGDPLYLSSKYKHILNEFKTYFIVTLSFCFILLTFFFYKENIVRKKAFSLEFTLFILAICSLISVISYYQFKRASDYAKLRQKDFLIAPSSQHNNSSEYNCSPDMPVENPLIKDINGTVAITPTITAVPTTPASTTATPTTPAPTINPVDINAKEFTDSRYVLSEPTLKYSDFCSLGPGDIKDLLTASNLSFADKAKFTKLKKGCNADTTAKINSAAQSIFSSGYAGASNASNFKAFMKENYNPVNVQDKWMSENAPDLK